MSQTKVHLKHMANYRGVKLKATDNSGNHADVRPLKRIAIAQSSGSFLLKFLLTRQHKVPFRNTFEANKGHETENQKRTANVQMSRIVEAVQACQPHFTLKCTGSNEVPEVKG